MKTKILSFTVVCIFIICIVGAFLGFLGFNYNPIARRLGGNITVELNPNRKLVDANWKGDSLWIITREMKEDEFPETYTYQEDSTYGMLEGKVTIIESK